MKSAWKPVCGLYLLLVCLVFNEATLSDNANAQNCSEANPCVEVKDGIVTVSPARSARRPHCKNVTVHKDQFEITESGVVLVRALNRTFEDWTLAAPQGAQICLPFSREFLTCKRWVLRSDEFEMGQDGLSLVASVYKRTYDPADFYLRKDGQEAVVCMEASTGQASQESADITVALGVTWIVSAISLIIAGVVCVAVAVPTTYRVVLPFYMLNLFVAYTVLIARLFGNAPSATVCLIYGVVLHFSLLSAFFWLNVVAFHVWRSVAWMKRGVQPSLSGCLLVIYIVYGWGSPFLISLITFLVEAGQLFPDVAWLRPEFQVNCWFGPRDPMLVFFYGPMAAILMANVVFFVMTIVNIQTATKYYSCKQTTGSNSKMIGTALHLIVVMGLCWIMEALSWAIGGDPRFWFFTDLLNGLQGFFVLIVVVADARIYNRIRCCRTTETNRNVASMSSDISIVTVDSKPNTIQK